MGYKNRVLNGDNMICNRSENMDLLVPYIDKPVYIKGYCWSRTFDGWVVLYIDEYLKDERIERSLKFDYKGRTYSVFGFLPSKYTMCTSSSYNNAIYKEEVNK